jgi:4-diphosphocytidyl-2-C-methyl-D-erythritol kinase
MILESLYGLNPTGDTESIPQVGCVIPAISAGINTSGTSAGTHNSPVASTFNRDPLREWNRAEAVARGWKWVGWRCHVPCKINLFLEVERRRADGYHDLDTVMHAVSLTDTLDLFPRDDGKLSLEVDLLEAHRLRPSDDAWNVPSDASNLVLRALQRLREELQADLGAHVVLHKRIPSQAGLGGGSADAAAALVLGSLLWSKGWEPAPASKIASGLGSDINFFLEGHNGRDWTARCVGRGEKVEPIPNSHSHWFVLVHPPVGCSTASIFRALADSHGLDSPRKTSQPLRRLLSEGREHGQAKSPIDEEELGRLLYNRLESAAVLRTTADSKAGTEANWVVETARRVDRYNPPGQCMTGSGSARFCLCSTQEQADKITRELRTFRDIRVYPATSWVSPPISIQAESLKQDA